MSVFGLGLRVWLRNNTALILTLIVLSAAILGAWLNQTWDGSPRAQEAIPTPLPDALSGGEILLPAYAPPPDGSDSLTRRSELLTIFPNRPRVEVLRYTVQAGDSVFGIASKFNLEPETILWGNFEVLNDDPHLLRPGQELNILPVDGTFYEWQPDDTLSTVAEFFGVDAQAILDWPGNELDPVEPTISSGQWLIVPGGRRAFRQWLVPTIARGRAGVGTAYGPGGCSGDFSGGNVGGGGFIWPSANRSISGNDFWAGHLAIDIAAGVGDSVWAADAGVVVFSGWSTGGYGNMIMIDHGNGWQTVYAHLSRTLAPCGQSVSQGNVIGLAGSTGNSTGAHLHFEVRFQDGFINPWFVLP